ncbi:MAG: tellurite resistance TerB family protein [Myxococcota bacterium]|nr:tellurite resistance TerB family protein [Myxococcota bacterium]
MPPDSSLLTKVARKLGQAPAYAEGPHPVSILSAAAGCYGLTADIEELTQPTGYDPDAARLFEAIIESAFVVAHADGEFDATEQATFRHVVLLACAGRVAERQVSALLADLSDQLAEDGIDKRIDVVGRAVRRPEQAREVLRVAALLAQVSGGVSQVERDVMSRIAKKLNVGESMVDEVLLEAKRALHE